VACREDPRSVSPETDCCRSAQPYGSSYFLPGKIAGKTATFLLDAGCTTNLLIRRLFDTLGTLKLVSLESYKGVYGTLANGSCIPFYGIITLPVLNHNQVIHKTFIVSYLKKDAIFGMPFQCSHGFPEVGGGDGWEGTCLC